MGTIRSRVETIELTNARCGHGRDPSQFEDVCNEGAPRVRMRVPFEVHRRNPNTDALFDGGPYGHA